jgi:hypothetical protein
MSTHSNKAGDAYGPPPPPQWKAEQLLQLIYRFNSHCIQLIGQAVTNGDAWHVPAVIENPHLWSSLDESARARAGQVQFLILDVRFHDDDWWQQAIAGNAPSSPQAQGHPLVDQLMEETLLLATQVVSWDPHAARMTLGMSPTVAEWLQGLHPQLLASIRRRHGAELQLRWQDDWKFWRSLLIAARDDDEQAMRACRLDARLLYGGDMFQVCQ